MTNDIHLKAEIPETYRGYRLDAALAEVFSDYSRSQITKWIKAGNVYLNTMVITKPRYVLEGNEHIEIQAVLEDTHRWLPQSIALDILYEDDHLLVINKPPGLVVHPGAGVKDQTLLNALLGHDERLAAIPRAGIIHRLDKDTSGLLVIACTLKSHKLLTDALKAREVKRQYTALVKGELVSGGTIDAPIGRHPTKRTKMAVVQSGREAVTHYRIIKRYKGITQVNATLETGRTHQIRVHFAYIQAPLIGDSVYNNRGSAVKAYSKEMNDCLRAFPRQALHAKILGLHHPETNEYIEWESPLPDDFNTLITQLEQENSHEG